VGCCSGAAGAIQPAGYDAPQGASHSGQPGSLQSAPPPPQEF
jgi:hypothetical protein